MSDARTLLAELASLGVWAWVVDDRLRYRPAEAVTSQIRERMVRLKPELIALLLVDGELVPEYGDGHQPNIERCPKCGQGDFVRPRPQGMWCCARCDPYHGLKPADLEWWPRIEGTPILVEVVLAPEQAGPVPTRQCWSCKGAEFWRLRPFGPWTCSRCHPPQPPREGMETTTVAEVDG